jgi:hypothetical protein
MGGELPGNVRKWRTEPQFFYRFKQLPGEDVYRLAFFVLGVLIQR